MICLQDINRGMSHTCCICRDVQQVTVCFFRSSNAYVIVTTVLHLCYTCMYSTCTLYSAECASMSSAHLCSRTAFGLQMHSLMASSTLHALCCRLRQTSKQQKRVNFLPLKTFGTTSIRMDLEPSYDLLKLANPKSSCRQRVVTFLVAPIHSLSVAAGLWQQLYCMSAEGSMQSSMPLMDYMYHSLQFLFAACSLS